MNWNDRFEILIHCGIYYSTNNMELALNQLIKDISKVDVDDILSCWSWRLQEMKQIIIVSCLGDLFLMGQDDAIYWLQTDEGKLTKVANSKQQFEQQLDSEENIDKWFLPLLIEKLLLANKTLKENEVYSLKKMSVMGG